MSIDNLKKSLTELHEEANRLLETLKNKKDARFPIKNLETEIQTLEDNINRL